MGKDSSSELINILREINRAPGLSDQVRDCLRRFAIERTTYNFILQQMDGVLSFNWAPGEFGRRRDYSYR